jgi:hypothetical protein
MFDLPFNGRLERGIQLCPWRSSMADDSNVGAVMLDDLGSESTHHRCSNISDMNVARAEDARDASQAALR